MYTHAHCTFVHLHIPIYATQYSVRTPEFCTTHKSFLSTTTFPTPHHSVLATRCALTTRHSLRLTQPSRFTHDSMLTYQEHLVNSHLLLLLTTHNALPRYSLLTTLLLSPLLTTHDSLQPAHVAQTPLNGIHEKGHWLYSCQTRYSQSLLTTHYSHLLLTAHFYVTGHW